MGFVFLIWFLFWFFFSSGEVSAAQQVGQGEERSAREAFLSHCVNETLSKKHERRQQYTSLLCSSCRRGRS